MKILHTADLHLKDKVTLGCLENIVAAAHDCEAIIIAGDMFDKNSSYQAIEPDVLKILESYSGDVFIIPGNHDREFLAQRASLSRNSVVFQETGSYQALDYKGIELWPIPFAEGMEMSQIHSLKADPANSLLIVHGTYYDNSFFYEDEHKVYFPIFEQDIRDKFSYVALGHYHRFIRHELGRTLAINPGAPRITRKSDLGPRVVSIIDTDTWDAEIVRLDAQYIEPLSLQVQVFEQPDQWSARLDQLLQDSLPYKQQARLLVQLSGTLPPGISPQECRDSIEQHLKQEKWAVEATDISGLSQIDSGLVENTYVNSLLQELDGLAQVKGLDSEDLRRFTLSRLNTLFK